MELCVPSFYHNNYPKENKLKWKKIHNSIGNQKESSQHARKFEESLT
jgi:hypothetical protein